MPFEKLAESRAAAFLFAFDDELDVRHLAFAYGKRFGNRRNVQDDSRLVVRGSAPVKATVADFGVEGGAFPERFPHRRLHVVMRVEQNGRIFRSSLQFGEDGGSSALRGEQLRVRKPVAFEKSLDGQCGTAHFVLVETVEADGWNADQRFQKFDVARKRFVDARR